MWQDVFNLAVTNGIFAVLFVILFFYSLKDGAAREKKYQSTIEKLSSHLNKIDDVKSDTENIKNMLIKEIKKEVKR